MVPTLMLHFTRHAADRTDRIAVAVDTLIIAGWTGRDAAAIQHHIEELAAIGVPRPSTVPLFYRVAATQLTQTTALQVLEPDTSGEVEPVIVALADGLWLGLGSDHTDRKAESISVALSKQLCGKVIGTELWRFDEIAARLGQADPARARRDRRPARALPGRPARRHPFARDLMARYSAPARRLAARHHHVLRHARRQGRCAAGRRASRWRSRTRQAAARSATPTPSPACR